MIYQEAYSVPRQAKPSYRSPLNPYYTVCPQKLSEVLHYGNLPISAWLCDSKYHVRETLPRFRESYESAIKNGAFEVVGYCDKHKYKYSYFVGQELTDL
ncbi:hypothetical protein QUA54_26245 [Microcoleus sp. MOSTC5]|uniref:hypothetical protein n=1 Tax=Microcoleus sp. MOSTC5 TaxID=3055378 RepID=UPI002FD791E3